MRPRGLLHLLASLVVLGLSPAQARSDDELADDLIHSDLPLFESFTENVWPQSFSDEESFGCVSPIAYGDWAFREQDAEQDDYSEWYRIRNYGVFHCWANVGKAYRKKDLEGVESRPSFFVLLGTTRDNKTELWAAQIGAIPGSDYLLLSRPSGKDMVTAFNVLQAKCPTANVRDAGSLDILLTRYCSINTRAELIRLARRMAHRPPLGTLSLIEPYEGDTAEEAD